MDFFKDLKVVELASVLAGPAVGMFFAELGAHLIKFENAKVGGDVTRTWRLAGESNLGPSAYYAAVNYRKEVRMTDLTDPESLKSLHAELANADLVISNFQPNVASKLGLMPDDLRKQYPKLIIALVGGYANSNKPAYDAVLQAETGWISMNGTPGQLAKLPVAIIDLFAAHQLKEACLLALIHRERSGEGSIVCCDLERAALASLVNQASNYAMSGTVAKPIGTAHPNIAPYGDTFWSADMRQFLLAVGSDKQFENMCSVMSIEPDTKLDFKTNTARLENRAKLVSELQAVFGGIDMVEIAELLESKGIPFGIIKPIDEVMQSPAAKAMMRMETHEGYSTIRLSGNAFKASFLNED